MHKPVSTIALHNFESRIYLSPRILRAASYMAAESSGKIISTVISRCSRIRANFLSNRAGRAANFPTSKVPTRSSQHDKCAIFVVAAFFSAGSRDC